MAASRLIDVANTIVGMLNADVAALDENGGAISPVLFTAKRTYAAEYTNVQLKTLQVDVRHPVVSTAEESRGGNEDTYGIEIALQQVVDKTNLTAIDALVKLSRRAARLFPANSVIFGGVINQTDGVQVIENLHSVFDPTKLAANQFYSLISLALREFTA
jgi:hypothetical protein